MDVQVVFQFEMVHQMDFNIYPKRFLTQSSSIPNFITIQTTVLKLKGKLSISRHMIIRRFMLILGYHLLKIIDGFFTHCVVVSASEFQIKPMRLNAHPVQVLINFQT